MIVKTKSAQDTIKFGKKIGGILQANEIVALEGPLGAGKTTLVQGIAEGLGVKDYITSPTFIIINEYHGRLPLFHLDLYRLNNAIEVAELGVEEYFQRGGVCVIEWAEKMKGLVPARAEKITIANLSEKEREICVSSGLAARLK